MMVRLLSSIFVHKYLLSSMYASTWEYSGVEVPLLSGLDLEVILDITEEADACLVVFDNHRYVQKY